MARIAEVKVNIEEKKSEIDNLISAATKNTKKTAKKIDKRNTIKVFEGFAGYGGATFGLRRAGIKFDVVGYSEFDKFASKLYDANHKDEKGDPIKNWGDITQINPE